MARRATATRRTSSAGSRADFHFDARNAGVSPTRKLIVQLLIGVAGEAAAAINRHVSARRTRRSTRASPRSRAFRSHSAIIDDRDGHRGDSPGVPDSGLTATGGK